MAASASDFEPKDTENALAPGLEGGRGIDEGAGPADVNPVYLENTSVPSRTTSD